MSDLSTFLAKNRGQQDQLPPVDLRGAIEKTNTKQGNMGVMPYVNNALGSVARGMTQVVETPYNILNNAPRIFNMLPGVDGVKKLSETGKEVGGPIGNAFASMGEDPLIDAVDAHYPGMGGVGGIKTPNPNYPSTSNIAEAFGSGVTGLGAINMAAKTPGIAGKFAQWLNAPVQAAPKAAVAGELASAAGGETGRIVAEKNDMGPVATFFAQMLGSLGPGALAYSAPNAMGKLFSREGGDLALDAMERQGVRPSVGMTGGKAAAQLESGASAIPFFSTVPENVRTQQFNQFDDALTGAAGKMRPAGTGPMTDPALMSQQVYDIAEGGAKKMRGGFGAREEALVTKIGADTMVDTTQTRAALTKMLQTADAKTAAALNKEIGFLDEIADPATGAAPYAKLRKYRSNFGAGIEDDGILKGAKDQLYKGTTADLETAATKAGAGDEFKSLMSEQAAANADDVRLSEGGDFPQADKLGGGQLERSGQFLKQAYANPDKMEYIRRNATPEQWDSLRANIAQDLGLAKAGAQDAAGEIVSPQKFITEWNKMDPRVKNMLFDDNLGTRQTLDDLALIADAFKQRGLEANTSRTAGTGMGAMEIKGAAKTTALLATGAAGATNLPATIAAAGLTYGAVKGLMSETLARWAAGRTPTAVGTVGARVPGALMHGAQDGQKEEKRPPLRPVPQK